MSLIKIQNAYLAFSNLEILHKTKLNINEHERICLIGKNGTGKSTLLKVINRMQELDQGEVVYQKDIKIAYLSQENPKNLNISVYDFLKDQQQYALKNKKKIIIYLKLIK